MEAHEYWRALAKGWAIIVVLAVVGGLTGAGYAFTRPSAYEATSSVFVSTTQGSTTDQLSQGANYTQNLVASYTRLATTPKVLQPVIDELGLSESATRLATQISATNPLDTVIVQIQVTTSSAQQSANIANAVAASLRTVTLDLAPVSATGQSQVSMTVVASAQAPTSPSGPNRLLMIITGLLAGLIVGVIAAIIRLFADNRVRSADDVERTVASPVIGTVRRLPENSAGVAVPDVSTSAAGEDYRRIAATLPFATAEGTKTVLVAAVSGAEAGSVVALNLALATAERGRSVVVVDADLRTAAVTSSTGLPGDGFGDVLGGADLRDSLVTWTTDVDVLATSPSQSNPQFALASAALADTVTALAAAYDLVIVVSPGITDFSDALTLSRVTEGTLVVADSSTRRRALSAAVESLEAVHAPIVGVVLTDVGGRVAAETASTAQDPAATSSARPATR
jgi:capsular polysaccharide biosynthesis protein